MRELVSALSPKVTDELLRECAEMLHSYWGGGVENRRASLVSQQNCYLLLDHVSIPALQAEAQRKEKEKGKGEAEAEGTAKGEGEGGSRQIGGGSVTMTRVLGHVKMNTISKNSDLHFGNSKCGIVTSVIVNSNYRRDGSGYGRLLMTLLEEKAREDGYCYLYLWTNDAMGFYLKLGYQPTERVVEFTSVFRSLERNVISKFESMLSSKLQQTTEGFLSSSSSSSPSPSPLLSSTSSDSQLPYIYYKKRLLDEHPLQIISPSQWRDSLDRHLSHHPSSSGSCYVNLLRWSPQIGPSCGIQALRFCLDYLSPHFSSALPVSLTSASSPVTLLQRAISAGLSNDGEIFNIFSLLALISLQHDLPLSRPLPTSRPLPLSSSSTPFPSLRLPSLEISVASFSSLSWSDLTSILTSPSPHSHNGGLVVIPYDRNPIGNTPCEENGRKAHYGVICGYMEHPHCNQRDQDQDKTPLEDPERWISLEEDVPPPGSRSLSWKWGQLDQSPHSSSESPSDDDSVDRYLILLQGMSSKPIVAPHSAFLSSNQQLFHEQETHQPMVSNREYVVPIGGPILADLCLIFRVL
jgi:N-acetylglutamate synthase-like GNAT family acetyltransferase